jgi:hypothetical protein
MTPRIPSCVTGNILGAADKTVAVTATLYVRTGTATASEAIAAATAGLQAYFATINIGETAYKQQIEDALIYDSAIVRNVAVSAPTGDTTTTAHEICKLGTVTLTVTFV